MKVAIYILLISLPCPAVADEVNELLLDTALDAIFHKGKEVNSKRDKFDYDEAVCENGAPSPIISNRRSGCANKKTQIENYNEFKEYTINRDNFLQNQQ